ncbi:Fumitremorgin C synthase [Achaetomium macrosporum]|uniref:Fumitremorgin C synthase n=1 Tax=Achaetomium macrosporum TaxID=79813 RepID=A0AAN7C161_9PEZI|nr:Fumitremorgin C synthase [Achaetomium macrosporum]
MPGLSLLLAVVALGLISIFLRRLRHNLPPGPKPAPLLGNLHQHPKSLQWLHLYHWSKKYGPVMHLSMGGQPLVILSTHQAAHDLLSKRSVRYSDRPRMVMAGELVTKGMHMLLRPYDEWYRLHQRMEAPHLNLRSASAYRPLQDMESRQLLFDVLHEYSEVGAKGVDFHHHFERAMASFIYCVNYGYRLKTGYEQELMDGKRVQAEFARTGQVGAYLVDSFPSLNYLPKALAPWKKEAEELRNSPSILGILADANLDTSTVALDWFIVAWITSGSRWVAKAQSLLDEVVGRDRLPTFEDRPKLAYIDAIASETLRWRPVVVGGVPHFTMTEDTYMGYHIPANSIVLANGFAITRDESVFGGDVDNFIPERWLADENGHNMNMNKEPAMARMLWAFDVEAGVDEKTGQRHKVDDMDCTEGFVKLPKLFRAEMRPRGQRVRDVILRSGTTHDIDHAEVLSRTSRERR